MYMISEILEEYLRAEAERALLEDDYQPGVYWPSEVWRCIRASYLRRVDKRPPTQQTIGYTTLGNILHTWVAQTLQAAGDTGVDKGYAEKRAPGHWTGEVESEVNVRIPIEYVTSTGREHLVLSGRMDNVVILKRRPTEARGGGGGRTGVTAQQTLIVEVKSVAGYRAPQSEADELPFKEHRAQLNCYLKAYPYAQGVILYVSRRDLEMREYPVRYDETLWLETEARLRILHEYLKRGVTPPPEAKMDPRRHWECAHCPYHDVCYPTTTAATTSAGAGAGKTAGSTAPATPWRAVNPQPAHGHDSRYGAVNI